MNSEQIEVAVVGVLAAVLKCEAVPDSSRQNTPKWDSLKHIEIIFAIEDELGIRFSEEELATLDSVNKIVNLVLRRNAT